MDTNAAPLLFTISETFDEPDQNMSLEVRVMHAAVHGWFEGHIAAPEHRIDRDAATSAMPAAPFPDPTDRRLTSIVDETLGRFTDGEEPAAVSYAAALGWKTGRHAGQECPGCNPEGHTAAMSQAMRSGEVQIRFERTR
jgi:hypothetical protein